MNSISGIPTAITRFNAGYGTKIVVIRIGGFVIANGTFVVDQLNQYDGTNISETVPQGYRPSTAYTDGSISAEGAWIPFACSQSSELGQGFWNLFPDGRMKFSNARGFTGARRFSYNAIYFTDDEWPTS